MTTYVTRPADTTLDPSASGRRGGARPDVDALIHHLDTPRPYQEVEDLEAEMLVAWRSALSGESSDLDELEACCTFFSRLGFLFKYKVYGVKIALPFGYSLFDLHDGEGFSFQVHEEPKLEGFHVLAPKPKALLYVADRREWEEDGQAWARSSLHDLRAEELPRGGLVPRAGDVAAVKETGVVHTALGCVLEEYASCSVDSVIRLHDQNSRAEVPLPAHHPSVPALLRRGSTGLPARHLERSGSGWSQARPGRPGEVIDTTHVRGWREVLAPGSTMNVPAGAHVTCIVVVRGHVSASVSRIFATRRAGEVVVVPPGLPVTIAADDVTTLSVHQVPAALATFAWSR